MSIPALKGIELEVEKGEFLAIAGVSGSGKSTMINSPVLLSRFPVGSSARIAWQIQAPY